MWQVITTYHASKVQGAFNSRFMLMFISYISLVMIDRGIR